MSRDERDAAYNNSNAVKNSAELNAAREAQSAAFRKAHPEHLDIPYGPGERNKWDLFPAADPNAPCLVFIHGGYWQRNSREMFANLIAGPYAHGWAAALPGYTLAPDASLTEIVAEINAALDWLAAQRRGARHQRQGRAVGLVGRRASDGAVPRPSAGQRRAGDLRHLRAGADPRHLSQREASAVRRGDRRAVAAAPADDRQAAGHRLRHRRAAAAGRRQPRPARAARRPSTCRAR